MKIIRFLLLLVFLGNGFSTFASRDVAVHHLVQPAVFLCKGDTFQLAVAIENTGTDTVNQIPVTVVMSGIVAGFFTATLTDTLLPGAIKTVWMNQVACPTNGVYHFVVYSSLNQDGNRLNDTLKQTSYIANLPTNLTIENKHACLASTFTLKASTPNGLIYWFASDTSQTQIATGDYFYTPMLTHSEIYWAEAHSFVNTQVGALDTAIGAAAGTIFYSDAMVFDVAKGLIIDSIAVYPINSGKVIIRLLDAFNTVLARDTTLITTGGGKQFLHPNFILSPGLSYKLDALGTTTGLMRNTNGANYPYAVPGVFSINGNTLNPNYFLFFYDWHLRLAGCAGPRLPVYANVRNNPPVASFNMIPHGQLIEFVNTSIEADSAFWKFGDGISNILYSPNHIYPNTGTFTVTLYVYNDCGVDSLSVLFLVTSDGITKLEKTNSFPIYPSPAHDEIHFLGNKQAFSKIEIYNVSGQVVSTKLLSNTDNNEVVSISDLAAGMYFVKSMDVKSGNVAYQRFVKE